MLRCAVLCVCWVPVQVQRAKNVELDELDCGAICDEEFYAARLYTGPMFAKYNAVLRGVVPTAHSRQVRAAALPADRQRRNACC